MRNLFNFENPFFQMLSRVMDFIVLNFFFTLCCIPVVTIGASLAALHKVMQGVVTDTENHLYTRFFTAFKENFKQSTLVWLATLVLILSLAADFFLITAYFRGTVATVLYVLLAILTVIVISILNYLYPLLVRYDNTLREHIFNAVILSLSKFFRTLGLLFLTLLPVLLFLISPIAFVGTLMFWATIGFSFLTYLANVILKPVYTELESGSDMAVGK